MLEDGEPVVMKRGKKGTFDRLKAQGVPAGIAGGSGA